jgi:DNA-directed RNA polymerase subunit alpha
MDIEMVVEVGRGYSPAEERTRLPLGEIPVDAIFSPVRKAAYRVERTRIGQQTDYDKLNMEVWTDGTIAPEDALTRSAKILVEHLGLLAGAEVTKPVQDQDKEQGIPSRVYDAPIEELELTVRAYNCLKRAGITKVGEILRRMEKGEEEMLAIRNFGKKSLDELVDKLREKNYLNVPGVDLTAFFKNGSAARSSDEDEEDDGLFADIDEEVEEEA